MRVTIHTEIEPPARRPCPLSGPLLMGVPGALSPVVITTGSVENVDIVESDSPQLCPPDPVHICPQISSPLHQTQPSPCLDVHSAPLSPVASPESVKIAGTVPPRLHPSPLHRSSVSICPRVTSASHRTGNPATFLTLSVIFTLLLLVGYVSVPGIMSQLEVIVPRIGAAMQQSPVPLLSGPDVLSSSGFCPAWTRSDTLVSEPLSHMGFVHTAPKCDPTDAIHGYVGGFIRTLKHTSDPMGALRGYVGGSMHTFKCITIPLTSEPLTSVTSEPLTSETSESLTSVPSDLCEYEICDVCEIWRPFDRTNANEYILGTFIRILNVPFADAEGDSMNTELTLNRFLLAIWLNLKLLLISVYSADSSYLPWKRCRRMVHYFSRCIMSKHDWKILEVP
ncbi:hypothetical protein DFH07DRAFT_1064729, partial [Mycena maculata]